MKGISTEVVSKLRRITLSQHRFPLRINAFISYGAGTGVVVVNCNASTLHLEEIYIDIACVRFFLEGWGLSTASPKCVNEYRLGHVRFLCTSFWLSSMPEPTAPALVFGLEGIF